MLNFNFVDLELYANDIIFVTIGEYLYNCTATSMQLKLSVPWAAHKSLLGALSEISNVFHRFLSYLGLFYHRQNDNQKVLIFIPTISSKYLNDIIADLIKKFRLLEWDLGIGIARRAGYFFMKDGIRTGLYPVFPFIIFNLL